MSVLEQYKENLSLKLLDVVTHSLSPVTNVLNVVSQQISFVMLLVQKSIRSLPLASTVRTSTGVAYLTSS